MFLHFHIRRCRMKTDSKINKPLPILPTPPSLPKQPTLPTLPQEVWSLIVSNMSVIDKLAVAAVSRCHYAAVRDPSAWKDIQTIHWNDFENGDSRSVSAGKFKMISNQKYFSVTANWWWWAAVSSGCTCVRAIPEVPQIGGCVGTRRALSAVKV